MRATDIDDNPRWSGGVDADPNAGVAACELAAEAGADWVDLNCGCPIYEATRRGLGSALLRKPAKLARLVGGLVDGSPLPVTVKIRMSSSAGGKDVNYLEHIEALAALGDSKPALVRFQRREPRRRRGSDVWIVRGAASTPSSDPSVAQVTLHGRTATQRYSKPASWADIEEAAVKAGGAFPVLGNGDVSN